MKNTTEMKQLKMNLLGGMNDYILNNVDDEDDIELWLMCGVPDMADEDDIEFIAEDEELWTTCCRIFGKIVGHME